MKRALCLFLAVVMLFTSLPLTALAATVSAEGTETAADGAQTVAISEVLELASDMPVIEAAYHESNKTVSVEHYPSGANLYLAAYSGGQMKFTVTDSVNGVFTLPEQDFDQLKVFALDENHAPMCEAKVITLDTHTVRFYDGERLLEEIVTPHGEPLIRVPDVNMVSKDDAIFVGYYTDAACTRLFYSDDPVTSNMRVYAKYEQLELENTEPQESYFTLQNQQPDLSFTLQCKDGAADPIDAATLLVMDGSDSVELAIIDNGDGTYTLSAPNGFTPGATYELQLADGWVFAGKSEAIRTASFSIFMEEQMNLEMSDDIVYIADTAALTYTMDGEEFDVLTANNLSENGGTFAYDTVYAEGTTLCIYEGKHPEQRDAKVSSDLVAPVVYVKVISAEDGVVTFRPVEASEQFELYNVPDNFPIQVEDLNAPVVDLDNLDLAVYQAVAGEEVSMASAQEAIAKGDFVTLYVGELTDDSEVRYGRITAYDAQTGAITYTEATKDDIIHSMDTYMTLQLSGEDLVSDEDAERLVAELTEELDNSDVAEEMAYLLADVISQTNGFEESISVEDFVLTDAEGNFLSEGDISLMGSSKVKIDKLKIRPQIIRSGGSLHFYESGIGSVQLALQVEMQLSVETDGGTVITELKATFVEEVGVDPKLKAWHGFGHEYNQVPNAIGLRVSGHVDVLNYTALSFDAKIYTAENNEKKEKFETLQAISKSPLKELGIETMNSDLLKNLKDLGEMMDKYEYLTKYLNTLTVEQDELKEDVKEAIKEIEQYAKGEKVLQFKELASELKRKVVTSDMMNLIYLGDKGLDAEYYSTLDDLMGRYKEMIKQETEWMDLVEKEIFSAEVCYYGIALGIDVSFVVSLDVSLAIGSNLEYEVGKRFTVWYLLTGDLHSDHGCTSTNIIDEKFSFQFYIMGRLGLRAGLRARVFIGLFSGKFASIGLAIELGPYLKLYGFFVYNYNRILEVGSSKPKVESETFGALFIEIGVYFKLDVDASAVGGLLSWDTTILEKELPIVQIGDQYFVYAFAANMEGDVETVRVIDQYPDTPDVITMRLPDSRAAVKRMDMKSGEVSTYVPFHADIHYSLSNSAYQYDKQTQTLTVQKPEGARYIACDLTMTYRRGKAAFSTKDLAVTIPLVWHNLEEEVPVADVELNIVVGNDHFGWHTITWDQLYVNGELIDLPDAAALINYLVNNNYDPEANYKYASGGYTYTNAANADGKNQIVDKGFVYVCELQNRSYPLEVAGVANGNTGNYSDVYQFHAIFGECFDFSDLNCTGINDHDSKTYTKYSTVRTYEEGETNPDYYIFDFFPYNPLQPLNAEMCELLETPYKRYIVKAVYADNSATATFTFNGLSGAENVTQTLLKGTMPDFSAIGQIAAAAGMDITAITPTMGRIDKDTTYTVYCKTAAANKVTVTFHDGMGGTTTLTAGAGSVLALPGLIREGYDFAGWYSDAELTKAFTGTKVPSTNTNLYAKWTGQTRRIFVESLRSEPIFVTYGQPIGDQLPALKNEAGTVFGWITDRDGNGGGKIIKEETVVDWKDYKILYQMEAHIDTIDLKWDDLFRFYQTGSNQNNTAPAYIYDGKDHSKKVFVYEGPPPYGEEYDIQESDFIIRFRKHGTTEFVPVIEAGNYDAVITRPADEYRGSTRKHYEQWEAVVELAVSVRPIEFELSTSDIVVVDNGMNYIEVKVSDDLLQRAGSGAEYSFKYEGPGATNGTVIEGTSAKFTGLIPNYVYHKITLTVSPNNPNYVSTASITKPELQTSSPEDSWNKKANQDRAWLDKYKGTEADPYLIGTAQELAGLEGYVAESSSNSLSGKYVKLTADIDLSGKKWIPIGNGNGKFKGIFDGDGHTISGVFVSTSNSYGAGLFTNTANGMVVKNMTVKDSYFCANNYAAGAIVAFASGNTTIQNCKVEATTVMGTGTGPSVGGIVGGSNGTSAKQTVLIENCVVDATISNEGIYANYRGGTGGIVGGYFAKSDTAAYSGVKFVIRNCAVYGEVTSIPATKIGGIVGMMNYGSVVNCANYAKVSATEYKYNTTGIGGIIGETRAHASGSSYGVSVRNNINLGEVVGCVNGSGTHSKVAPVITTWVTGSTFRNNFYLKDCAYVVDGETTTYYNQALYGNKDSNTLSEAVESPDMILSLSGKNLLDTLNDWVASEENTYSAVVWEATGPNGYPVPTNLPK